MVTLSFGDLIVLVSLFTGFAGVVFGAGKLSARMDSIEEWRRTMPSELQAIHTAIREVRSLIKTGV
jgi:hypothetical protein